MTTTNLFVELIVIGVGAACWVGMLILSLFGVESISLESLSSYPVLVTLLTMAYLLGIISDRAADFAFDKLFSNSLRIRHFGQKREYQDARRLVFNTSDRLADMHDYGRTRIRICRGWALNAVLIALSLNVLLHSRFLQADWFEAARIWGTVGFVLLSVSCWWSWRMLCSTEYLKISEHAKFLRSNERPDTMKTAA